MASFKKRRNKDGSTSWDVMVRVVGFKAEGKTFRTKLEAEMWAARTQTQAKGGTLAVSRVMTLNELIDDAWPRLTNPTAAAFAYWREHLGDIRLYKITPEQIAHHRDRLLGSNCRGHGHKTSKPRASATVRNYLIELSRLFAVAVKEMRVMESNPCAQVTKPRGSTEVVRYLSDAERKALLEACKASPSADLYPIVLFALTTGCRKGEVTSLQWAQVDLARRWAVFNYTKNGSERGVPLTTAVCALLAPRLERHRLVDEPKDAKDRELWSSVFPHDVTQAWHGAIAKAGIQNFRFHDLRHSCASTMVQNGANLAEVATLLGHKSLQMTMRYSHVSNAGTSRLVDRVMGDIA